MLASTVISSRPSSTFCTLPSVFVGFVDLFPTALSNELHFISLVAVLVSLVSRS